MLEQNIHPQTQKEKQYLRHDLTKKTTTATSNKNVLPIRENKNKKEIIHWI